MILTICHVQVEYRHTKTVCILDIRRDLQLRGFRVLTIILVEHTLEFRAEQSSTAVPALSTPGVERAALELDNGVCRVRALFLVERVPVLKRMSGNIL